MKKTLRLIALLLVTVTILSACTTPTQTPSDDTSVGDTTPSADTTTGGSDGATTPSDPNGEQPPVEFAYVDLPNLAEMSIVLPDSYASEVGMAATTLKLAINEAAGIMLKVGGDGSKKGTPAPEGTLEILIGGTNRPESAVECKYGDFVVKFVNNRLAINGGSPAAVQAAVEWFMENCIKDGKVLYPNIGYRYDATYSMADVVLLGSPLYEYRVESSDYRTDASELQEYISLNTGVDASDGEKVIRLVRELDMPVAKSKAVLSDDGIDILVGVSSDPTSLITTFKNTLKNRKSDTIEANDMSMLSLDDTLNKEFSITKIDLATGSTNATIKYTFEIQNSALERYKNISEFGMIYMLTDDTWGRDMKLGEYIIKAWSWSGSDNMTFTPSTNNGKKPSSVTATASTISGGKRFTAEIKVNSQEDFDNFYTVKGYFKYKDSTGKEQVAYTDYSTNSVYYVALDKIADKSGNTTQLNAIKSYVEVTRKQNYLNTYYNNRTTVTTNFSIPNHEVYTLSNGLYVREFTIDSGKGGDAVEVVTFGDVHLNYINEKDVEYADPATLATYRGRAWQRNGDSIPAANRAMEYASLFDATVLLGDVIDYISWGCMEVTEKLMFDKDPDILAAIGNHEPADLMQNDIPVDSTFTTTELYEKLQSIWPHDVSYVSKIVKNDSGVEKVMLVVMDNQSGRYTAGQRDKLKADIATAKAKKIPLLIFQHDNLLSNNTAEGNIQPIDNLSGDTHEKNFCQKGVGNANAITQEVYNLIVTNSDTIKGIFCGHQHRNLYSEIWAKNADGSWKMNGSEHVVIPQHVLTANAYRSGTVMKINIK